MYQTAKTGANGGVVPVYNEAEDVTATAATTAAAETPGTSDKKRSKEEKAARKVRARINQYT